MIGRRQGFWGHAPRLLLIGLLPYTSAQTPALDGLERLSGRAIYGVEGCYVQEGARGPRPAGLAAGRVRGCEPGR